MIIDNDNDESLAIKKNNRINGSRLLFVVLGGSEKKELIIVRLEGR
jgi:hypothetical protein